MNNFFGSKLNTVLLVILIILMVFAIKLMLENKELYFHPLENNKTELEEYREIDKTKILGNKEDLVSFSILPGAKVSEIVKATGSVKNSYFFEGNIGIAILDANKKLLKQGHGNSTTDWMGTGPVSFETTLDFTGIPKGAGYIEIQNDDPSDLPHKNDKHIFIPIVIE